MRLTTMACLCMLFAGCATPTVVETVQPGDPDLSCPQLQDEYAEATKLKKAAKSEKGVTAGNVARILFWPSIVATHLNANEAIAAADTRRVHLASLMSQKNCAVPEAKRIDPQRQ